MTIDENCPTCGREKHDRAEVEVLARKYAGWTAAIVAVDSRILRKDYSNRALVALGELLDYVCGPGEPPPVP